MPGRRRDSFSINQFFTFDSHHPLRLPPPSFTPPHSSLLHIARDHTSAVCPNDRTLATYLFHPYRRAVMPGKGTKKKSPAKPKKTAAAKKAAEKEVRERTEAEKLVAMMQQAANNRALEKAVVVTIHGRSSTPPRPAGLLKPDADAAAAATLRDAQTGFTRVCPHLSQFVVFVAQFACVDCW